MKLIVNDALTPVRTTILGPGASPDLVAEISIIIPGRGWRRVEESTFADRLRENLTDGTLRIQGDCA